MSTIHAWFDKNRGAAFGVLSTGSSIGGVIFPIMVSRLIKEVGFGWAMRTCGFLVLGLLIIANLTVKDLHPPQPQNTSRAQMVKPFREPEFVLLLLGFFFFTFGMYVPINYLPVQALQVGLKPSIVDYLVPILNAGSFFGRIVSGILGDKIGKYNIFVLVCYLTGISTLALWIPCKTEGGIIAFAAIFGFCSGAYVSLIGPLVAQISPLREIGFRTGIVFFVSSISGLVTNPIAGAILEKPNGWVGVKVFAGVFCLAGTTFILGARVYRVGWKLNVAF